MNQPLNFPSLDAALRTTSGIIRTLPENCQPQVRSLCDAIFKTALREQVAAEEAKPQIPPFDLSRFAELRRARVSTLSPADAQYMLRATISYLLLTLMERYEAGDKSSGDNGYAQTLQSLMRIYELTPEMIAKEALATGEAIING